MTEADPFPAPGAEPLPARALRLAALTALGAAAAATLWLAALRVVADHSVLAYTEGVVFASAERLAEGGLRALYPPSPASDRPFVIAPYSPLFYLEWVGARALLGVADSMLPGRIVALVALLACAGSLVVLLRSSLPAPAAAAPFALAWLASPFVIDSAAMTITDLPALAVSTAGVALVAARGAGVAWSAAPLFAAALLTKQSTAAGLVACAAYLALGGRPGAAARLALASLGLAATFGAALELHTRGGFTAATVGGLLQPLSLEHLDFLLDYLVQPWLFWVLVALALAALLPALRAPGPERLAWLYLAASVAVCLVTLGKLGSSTNYFLEPFLALCWTAGAGFAALRRVRAGAALQALALAGVAVAALPGVDKAVEHARSVRQHRVLVSLVERELAEVELDGWVLSGVDLFPLVESRGARPYLNDSFLYAVMWESGRWPADDLAADLACGRVGTVLPVAMPTREPGTKLGLFWQGWNFWNSPLFLEAVARSYERVPHAAERRALVLRHRTGECPALSWNGTAR